MKPVDIMSNWKHLDPSYRQPQIGSLSKSDLQDFDTARHSTTALLGMFAPVSVFSEYNDLIDYVYDSFDGKAVWSYPVFRIRALKFLSLVRADIGIYTDELQYTGNR